MLRRKKGPTVLEAAALDRWQVSGGTHEGNPLLTRFNHAFLEASDRPNYPVQIGVALPLVDPDEHGLPRAEERVLLDTAEELLIEQAGERGVLVGVITTSRMREFVLYTGQSDWIESFHSSLQEIVKSHSVQVIANRDPGWATYRRFVGK